MWKLFFSVLMFGFQYAYASVPDIDYAEEARGLLWRQTPVGSGSELRCRNVPGKAMKAKTIPTKRVCELLEWDNVLLAVKQPLRPIRLVKARVVQGDKKQGRKDFCDSKTPGFTVRCVLNMLGEANGLNTEFVVELPYGYKVYAIRRLGPTPHGRQEMVYSPYADELATPPVIAEGKKYLDRVIKRAIDELRKDKVESLAFPGKLVADLVQKDAIHNLGVVEHIDPDLFKQWKLEYLMNRVYVILALNREGAYNLAPSSAQASGLYQIIPRTYKDMVATYPSARLIPNYRLGTYEHVNAAKTAMVLLDHDLFLLTIPDRSRVYGDAFLYKMYSASTYNGGPSCPKNVYRGGLCARQMLERFGEFVRNNPSEENRLYVEKMIAVSQARKM